MSSFAQASFVIWAAIMANYIEDGAYSCLGGFDKLVALLGRRASDPHR
jgi:hypothetical protein